MNKDKIKSIYKIFPNINLIIELDRWASDNQLIHEHYYNIVYGLDSPYARKEIQKYVNRLDIQSYLKTREEMFYNQKDIPNLSYKLGEINIPSALLSKNLSSFLNHKYSDLKIIDLYLWNKNNLRELQ